MSAKRPTAWVIWWIFLEDFSTVPCACTRKSPGGSVVSGLFFDHLLQQYIDHRAPKNAETYFGLPTAMVCRSRGGEADSQVEKGTSICIFLRNQYWCCAKGWGHHLQLHQQLCGNGTCSTIAFDLLGGTPEACKRKHKSIWQNFQQQPNACFRSCMHDRNCTSEVYHPSCLCDYL